MYNPTKHNIKRASTSDPWPLTPDSYCPPIKGFRLTLRQRVALLSCALVLSLNVALVLFINLTATLQVVESEAAMVPMPVARPTGGTLSAVGPTPTAVSFSGYYSEP